MAEELRLVRFIELDEGYTGEPGAPRVLGDLAVNPLFVHAVRQHRNSTKENPMTTVAVGDRGWYLVKGDFHEIRDRILKGRD